MPTEPSLLGAASRDSAHSEAMPATGDLRSLAPGRLSARDPASASSPPPHLAGRSTRLFFAKALMALMPLALPASAQEQSAGSSSDGERLFDSYCSACHQYDDEGMGEAPPLESSPWVVGPSKRLVLILLHGVSGRIELNGRIYDREMPGFGRTLSDQETAALATYTRQRFGAAEPNVTAVEVKRIRDEHADRTEYWPADELLELR